MSNEEEDKDMELKDLIVQTLEANGLLAKMKAQIRSSVFMALDEAERGNQLKSVENPLVKQLFLLDKGILAASLVRDFLETLNLDFTLAVYDPEINDTNTMSRRDELAAALKLDSSIDAPLLLDLLNHHQQCNDQEVSHKTPTSNGGNLSSAKIDEIRLKFERLDKKRTGVLDRAGLSQLLAEILPHFNRTSLSKMVLDEIMEEDESDSRNFVDFKCFIAWYKRWYASCYHTVQLDDTLLTANNNTNMASSSNGKRNDLIEDVRMTIKVDKDDSSISGYSNKSKEVFLTTGGKINTNDNVKPVSGSSSNNSNASNGKLSGGPIHNSNSNSNKNLQTDNYDDDFTASGGATPRTSRADNSIGGKKQATKNRSGIVSDEDIDENISYEEESSKSEEVTQDKSISTINGNNDADFVDDVSI